MRSVSCVRMGGSEGVRGKMNIAAWRLRSFHKKGDKMNRKKEKYSKPAGDPRRMEIDKV